MKTCYCGCGTPTGATWAPGHDSNMAEHVIHEVYGTRKQLVDAHPKERDAYRAQHERRPSRGG